MLSGFLLFYRHFLGNDGQRPCLQNVLIVSSSEQKRSTLIACVTKTKSRTRMMERIPFFNKLTYGLCATCAPSGSRVRDHDMTVNNTPLTCGEKFLFDQVLDFLVSTLIDPVTHWSSSVPSSCSPFPAWHGTTVSTVCRRPGHTQSFLAPSLFQTPPPHTCPCSYNNAIN